MESSTLCRVCLASDRAVHRLADTPLEETYERMTRETLVVKGRPCCVCGVCLSALRRCRRFVETARRANIALDRWSRSPRTKMKLTETPLFSFKRSVTEVVEITSLCQPAKLAVKQESDNANDQMLQQVLNENTLGDKDNFFFNDIKYQVTNDLHDDNTQVTDNADSVHFAEYDNCNLANGEYVNMYDDKIDVEDVKLDIPAVLNNVGDETVPGTSNVEQDNASSDEDIPLQSLRLQKRVKLTEDTSVPALKKRRPITAGDQPGNTGPSPAFHKDGNMFFCSECQYKSHRKGNMKTHVAIHSSEKPFVCDICDYKTYQQFRLRNHLLIHAGKSPFACDKCQFNCTDKSNLNRHLMIHTGEKPFACNKCDYKCREKGHLKQHSMIHTGERPFECDKCDFKTILKFKLKEHTMIHTGEKPIACNKCDYKCIQKNQLKRHLMSHTCQNPFACYICDFKTSKKCRLENHLLINHTGKKRFACDICDFQTRHKYRLQGHLLVHAGNEPFACDKCQFKCTEKSSLKRHSMIHTGERPFECDKCEFKTNNKSKLKAHSMIHTGDKPFACNKCDYKCISCDDLCGASGEHPLAIQKVAGSIPAMEQIFVS